MHATVAEQEKIQAMLRQARALIQSGRQQIALLRPVWGAHLLGETLTRLVGVVDELEHEIKGAPADEGHAEPKNNEAYEAEDRGNRL